jgi:transposase
MPGSS